MKTFLLLTWMTLVAVTGYAKPLSISTGEWHGTRTDSWSDETKSYPTKISVRDSGASVVMEETYTFLPPGPESDSVTIVTTTTFSPRGRIRIVKYDTLSQTIEATASGRWTQRGKTVLARVNGVNWLSTRNVGTIEYILRKRKLSAQGRFLVTSDNGFFALFEPDFDIVAKRIGGRQRN